MEAKVDKAAEDELQQEAKEHEDNLDNNNQSGAGGGLVVASSRAAEAMALGVASKSVESVKGGEMLMNALDLVEAELPNFGDSFDIASNSKDTNAGTPTAVAVNKGKQYRNPLLLGLSPYSYMIRALRLIKAPDLEQALLVLPFFYVTRLISMLIKVTFVCCVVSCYVCNNVLF